MENALIKVEEYAMTVSEMVGQVHKIQEYMGQVMKEGEHYGTIPGTDKPTLLKPGAEKLCLAFRLDPNYEIIREVREKDWIAYTVKCTLSHIPTGQEVASGIGSCNSRETKYRYRSQNTGKPVPKEYWKKGRDPAILGGPQYTARKKDKQWVIFEQVENENPWDLDNTLIKMACKRALIAATLNGTAASDIFTQDLEDMPAEILGKEAPQKAEPQDDLPDFEPPKETVEKDKEGKRKAKLQSFSQKNKEAYYEVLGQHGIESGSETFDWNDEQFDSLVSDLKKVCK